MHLCQSCSRYDDKNSLVMIATFRDHRKVKSQNMPRIHSAFSLNLCVAAIKFAQREG